MVAIGNNLLAIILARILIGLQAGTVLGQNCSCAADLCCSRFGYCGTGDDYCGRGCQKGPCNPLPSTNNVSVANIVTPEFFNHITDQAIGDCPGKNFYSRSAFLQALNSYPQFGRVGSFNDSKREIAAFFGHVTLETSYFCYIEEINGSSRDYCDKNNTQYPCVPGKGYYGRGPIQLSWNYNYGFAGETIGFDGLNAPETVATDPLVSFKTAIWYWMNYCHSIITSGQGFGSTIRAINGALECNGRYANGVNKRVQYYTEYCNRLGVEPGGNLTC